MENIDPAYDYIEQEIETLKNLMAFGDSRLCNDELSTYLLRLIVEQRQQILFMRIQFRLYMVATGFKSQEAKALQADRALVTQDTVFRAAFPHVDDPVSYFGDWLKSLDDKFAELGVQNLMARSSALTPPP